MQRLKELTGLTRSAADDAKRQVAEVQDTFRAPSFLNIGGEYDATFLQSTVPGARFVLTTPNLFASDSASLTLTTLHEAHSSTSAGQDQVTGNLRWCGTFGPATLRPPTAVARRQLFGFAPKRPVHVDVGSYLCLPINFNEVKPTAKVTAETTDIGSGVAVGVSSRFSGSEFLHSLHTRGPFGTFEAGLRNDPKLPNSRVFSGSATAALYRDALLDRSVTAGVQVDSAHFDSSKSSFPSRVAAVTLKTEYDQQQLTVDTTVKATPYAQTEGTQNTLKISDVSIRAVYAHNLGKYPRWCAGASVGVCDGGDASSADPTVSSGAGRLTTPLASTAFYYQLNPNNKLKLGIDSARRVQSTYQYTLTNEVHFLASLHARFPACDFKSVGSVSAAAAGAQTALGIAVQVGAL